MANEFQKVLSPLCIRLSGVSQRLYPAVEASLLKEEKRLDSSAESSRHAG
jgi:hypothetical protein